MNYKLPQLSYEYDALEPQMDAETIKIHHLKHHAKYLENFNNLIKVYSLEHKGIKEIFQEVSHYPVALRNNGGGFYNHSLFWEVLTPGGSELNDANLKDGITKYFGTPDNFKHEFTEVALNHFGSGWAWLIQRENGELLIYSTPNQDNSLMDSTPINGEPLLCLDLWEHAYYLKYQNNRKDYINAFWNLVNWDHVAELFNKNNINI